MRNNSWYMRNYLFFLSNEIAYLEEENNRNIGRWMIYRGRQRVQMRCWFSGRRRINKGKSMWIIIFFKWVSTNKRTTRTFNSFWDWPLTWALFGLEFSQWGIIPFSIFIFFPLILVTVTFPSVKTFQILSLLFV